MRFFPQGRGSTFPNALPLAFFFPDRVERVEKVAMLS
jgi:hypothetical protein